jgi:hypothetical protein
LTGKLRGFGRKRWSHFRIKPPQNIQDKFERTQFVHLKHMFCKSFITQLSYCGFHKLLSRWWGPLCYIMMDKLNYNHYPRFRRHWAHKLLTIILLKIQHCEKRLMMKSGITFGAQRLVLQSLEFAPSKQLSCITCYGWQKVGELTMYPTCTFIEMMQKYHHLSPHCFTHNSRIQDAGNRIVIRNYLVLQNPPQ